MIEFILSNIDVIAILMFMIHYLIRKMSNQISFSDNGTHLVNRSDYNEWTLTLYNYGKEFITKDYKRDGYEKIITQNNYFKFRISCKGKESMEYFFLNKNSITFYDLCNVVWMLLKLWAVKHLDSGCASTIPNSICKFLYDRYLASHPAIFYPDKDVKVYTL